MRANVPEFDATVKSTPYDFVCALGTEPDVEEFELYVIEYVSKVHFAYNVRFELVVNVPILATYVVPEPSAKVFQPAKS